MATTPFRADTPARRVALFGMLLALTVALSWLERLLPTDTIVLGAKLGLANLVVLCGLYLFPLPWAAGLTLMKIAITGLLFGNYYSLLYSLAGGALSFLAMYLCKRWGRTMGFTSIMGGIFHNIGQLCVARIILGSMGVLAHLPAMLLAGVGAGAAIGAVGALILRRLWGSFGKSS